MRVIAGTARGHHLKAPKRRATRPATDMIRGAIFDMLENMTSDWSRVLDLFSGTGAMGIEALSRGAGWADFVEHEPVCCAIIKENLESTKLAECSHIYCQSVARAISFLNKEYSIIIMDPPYADPSNSDMVTLLANSKLVGENTVVVVTHSSRLPLKPEYGPLKIVKEHRHGDSTINIYRKEARS